jgi:hypothetical protein
LFNGSRFAGTVLASRSAGLNEGAAVAGRLLVRDGPVVFVAGNNVVTLPDCDARAGASRQSSSTRTDGHPGGRQAGTQESADRAPSGDGSGDRRSTRTESADRESMADESTGDESTDEESTSRRSADGDSTGAESTGGESATGRSTGDLPTGDLPPGWPPAARLPGPDGSVPGFLLPRLDSVPSLDGLLGLGGLLPT